MASMLASKWLHLSIMTGEIIERNLVPSEEYIYGFANLSGLIHKKYGAFIYGISIGKRLDDQIIDAIKQGPTLEYHDYYNQINSELAVLAEQIKSDLAKAGIPAIIIEPTVHTNLERFDNYDRTLTVDVSHKMVATRAGLGWIGKTDLLISRAFGPRLRFVSLLIDRKPDGEATPVETSECGKCNICVEECPAQAASGELWNIHIHRNQFFDAQKCREMCGKLARERLQIDQRICGICISVCPRKKRTRVQPEI